VGGPSPPPPLTSEFLGVDLDQVNPTGDGNGPMTGTTRPFDMTVLSFWIYESFG
jgi:hypothetical protein